MPLGTVKAVCIVSAVAPSLTSAGDFHALVQFAGLENGNTASGTITLLDVSPTITAATLEASIKQLVKDELINTYSYSFGLLDTVRLIGALL